MTSVTRVRRPRPVRVRAAVLIPVAFSTVVSATATGAPEAQAQAALTRTAAAAASSVPASGARTGSGVGSVTLRWDKGDNDLVVVDRNGSEVTYRRSTAMGSLDLDDIDPTGPETFNPTSAARGAFQVKVRCFYGCEGSTVTVEAVVRGKQVALGSHTMTSRHEVWLAGAVNFDRTWDCNDDGTPDITMDDLDEMLTQAQELSATQEQVRRLNEEPCAPWIKPDTGTLVAGIPGFEKTYDAAFGLESPPGHPGRGLVNYTAWLNTLLDFQLTPDVYNYTDWRDVFVAKRYRPYPMTFKEQFLAAVPPLSRRDAPPSPFQGLHFNLTGMGGYPDLVAAILRGSKGMPAPGSPGVTDWELYNVMATAAEKTKCNRWFERMNLGGFEVEGYIEVPCPPWPAGLGLPDPDGKAR
jgi:hypothetical protein